MSHLREMPCRELVEQVTAYLEDTLDPVDRRRLEEHLAVCEGCRTYLEQLRVTLDTCGNLEPEQLSEPVRAELSRAFTAWAAERR